MICRELQQYWSIVVYYAILLVLACLSVNSFSGGVSYVTVISPSSSSSSSPLSSSTQLQPLPLPSTNLLISRSNSVSSKYPATTVDFLCLSLRESFVPCSVHSLLAPLIGSRLLYHIISSYQLQPLLQFQLQPCLVSIKHTQKEEISLHISQPPGGLVI